jgi:hypothetical protein
MPRDLAVLHMQRDGVLQRALDGVPEHSIDPALRRRAAGVTGAATKPFPPSLGGSARAMTTTSRPEME